jgi:alpha-tubulin suppressor-like RCC1 family protein
VIGSKREYFYSPWVKNEWGRYLNQIKAGGNKTLIPIHLEMDPSDLPEEFKGLQGIDITKQGSMQDLIHRIKKIIITSGKSVEIEEIKPLNEENVSQRPLLERAFVCLEIRDFEKADELIEKALNINPKDPHAYIGKLMAELKISKETNLVNAKQPLENYDNYRLAVKFADPQYKKVLESVNKSIIERLEKGKKERIYQEATNMKRESKNEDDFRCAANLFKSIKGYKDAEILAEECEKQALEVIYQQAIKLKKIEGNTAKGLHEAINIFNTITGYKNSQSMIEECTLLIKELAYETGLRKKAFSKKAIDLIGAARIFAEIPGYKDADRLHDECIDLAKKIERKKKRTPLLLTGFVISIVGIALVIFKVLLPNIYYNNGIEFLNEKRYSSAAEKFTSAKNFKNSSAQARQAYYLLAEQLVSEGDIYEAAFAYSQAGDYLDAKAKSRQIFNLLQGILACGNNHTVGVKEDGKVVAVGSNEYGQIDVNNWTDIVAVAAAGSHTIGLKRDGTVVATGDNSNGVKNVLGWKNVIAIATSTNHTAGLREDGRVYLTNTEDSEYIIPHLHNIVALAEGGVVAINSSGTALAFDPENQSNLSDWINVVSISSGGHAAIGVKTDGTVIWNSIYTNSGLRKTSSWEDIVLVWSGTDHVVALKNDKTVVAAGNNFSGQCNVTKWSNIIAVAAGDEFTVGLNTDGTVISIGSNKYKQMDVSGWNLFD